jgi:hypothetical protein
MKINNFLNENVNLHLVDLKIFIQKFDADENLVVATLILEEVEAKDELLLEGGEC